MDDLKEGLQGTFQRYWKPALAGAALGGTAATYLGRDAGPQGETPGQRRRRMLKNALTGVLLGGTAGLAIPAGAKIVSEPWQKAKPFAGGPTDSALGFVGRNIVPVGAGGVAGALAMKNRGQDMQRSFGNLFHQFSGMKSKPFEAGSSEALRAALETNPANISSLHGALGQHLGGDDVSKLRSLELLQEAGFTPKAEGASGKGAVDLLKGLVRPGAASSEFQGARSLLSSDGGALSRGIAKLPGATGDAASELWRRMVRPSISGRIPMAGKLGIGLAGVALANKLQERVMGE